MEDENDLSGEPHPYQKYYPAITKVMQQEIGFDLEAHRIDVHHWNYFNELRDKGIPLSEIMKKTDVDPKLSLYAMESARECVIKYNGNLQKLAECLEGKIKP